MELTQSEARQGKWGKRHNTHTHTHTKRIIVETYVGYFCTSNFGGRKEGEDRRGEKSFGIISLSITISKARKARRFREKQ